MNEKVENLILEHLRVLRADVGRLSDDMRGMHAEMRAMKQHMAAFMAHETTQDGDIASIKARIDRIERRLDIID